LLEGALDAFAGFEFDGVTSEAQCEKHRQENGQQVSAWHIQAFLSEESIPLMLPSGFEHPNRKAY
jgi:hypothetical protein